MRHPALPYLAITVGILMLATTPILVRLAQQEGLPSLAIANLRLIFAVTLLAPWVLGRYHAEIRALTRQELALIVVAGITIALFFVFFFNALTYTSVLIAGVLNGTNPLWVALMEMALLKGRLNRHVWLGLLLALAGSALFAVSGADSGVDVGENPLLGGGLALLAAFMAAAYYIIGRRVRARVSALPFLWLALVTGTITALSFALLTRTALTGYSVSGYLWVLLLTLGPQIMGQICIAWSLAHLTPTLVAIALQSANILSAVPAFFIFHEEPEALQILASAIILAGVMRVIVRPQTA